MITLPHYKTSKKSAKAEHHHSIGSSLLRQAFRNPSMRLDHLPLRRPMMIVILGVYAPILSEVNLWADPIKTSKQKVNKS
ncbi:hypothetical protein AOQ84DRAFT_45169 [Glonium stellatum]|uniref:Uncharacterized protein n=1 Tax=Glonium stellatum TaxID=574774 RepID=A0A8E2JST2_9PEZI|nr:hypothetical protein AOQ84DRAFT_45169 [Glonium stellatum]